MGADPWYTRLRHWVGRVGFLVFLWSWRTTENDYISSVFEENFGVSTYIALRDMTKGEIVYSDSVRIKKEDEEDDL